MVPEDTMDAWELAQLLDGRAATEQPYLEFLRSPALSAGLYVLDAGAADGKERCEPPCPAVDLARAVVVAPQAEVKERSRQPDCRWPGIVRQVGRTERGPEFGQLLEHLVDVPRWVLELDRQRDVARPG